tara:strand:- start:1078 stop:1533 length:456 start_codon:yes stop_codon:yes gene_type:complete
MKTKKIIIIFILLISTSCGYKPIYLKNNQLALEFNKIFSTGDKKLNRKIINAIGLKENISNNNLNELILKTSFKIEETSKNSKGQVETYRSIINIQLTIKKGDKIIKNKNFLNDFSYNNKDNKFELTQDQNEIKNNLINKSSEEILLFLNL